MIRRIQYFLRWLKWLRDGKPMIAYPGFHCGCCGKWVNRPFKIPAYKSVDSWADTIDLCDDELRCVSPYMKGHSV